MDNGRMVRDEESKVGSKLTIGKKLTMSIAALLFVVLALALLTVYWTGTLRSELAGARWIAIVLAVVALAVGLLALLVVRATTLHLRNIARELSEGAGQIASAAGQVSSSSQSLSQGASEQAAS